MSDFHPGDTVKITGPGSVGTVVSAKGLIERLLAKVRAELQWYC
jgi:hypothetical protein